MKKKILIANNLLEGGGVENLLKTLVWEWNTRYDITIMTDKNDNNCYKIFPSNVKYLHYIMFGNAKRPFRRICNLLNKIWKKMIICFVNCQKFDCVIALKEGDTMKFVSNLKAKKKLAWVHVDYSRMHWTKSLFTSDRDEVICMQKFDNVICVAENNKKSVCDVIGDPGNLMVRHNPVKEEEIINKSKQKIQLPEKMLIRFVSVGRLTYIKGYDMLLNVCKRLSNEGYDFEIWLIGDGEEKESLQEFIRKNNLTMVKLWGNQSNPYNIMKGADWFISTSRSEGFSLVTQEAAILCNIRYSYNGHGLFRR